MDPQSPAEAESRRDVEAADERERYFAFISYVRTTADGKVATADIEVATWLQEALESFEVPADLTGKVEIPEGVERERDGSLRLDPVCRDDTDFAAASSLRGALLEKLRRSRFLIVVCSPRVVASKWVNDEIREFRTLGRSSRILAVLIEGKPADTFPEALKQAVKVGEVVLPDVLKQAVTPGELANSGTDNAEFDEPLAADLRPRKGLSRWKLRRIALMRLAAAIIPCEYNELARRAEERVARQRRRILTGLACVAALILGLTAFGLYQRLRAERAMVAERINLALAHYGRGVEAETEANLPAAKLHFAKSLSIFETPDARKKLGDTWYTARRLWDVDLAAAPEPPGGMGPSAKPNRDRRPGAAPCLRFGRDGRRLFVGTREGEVRLLDAETGRTRGTWKVGVPVRELAAHPLMDRVAVGGEDGSVLILEASGRLASRATFSGPPTALAFSGDGRALAVGHAPRGMTVIDADDGQPWFRSPPGTHEAAVDGASFAPRGGEMIWSMERWLYHTDVASGSYTIITNQDAAILATAWGPGADPLLAWAGRDGPIQVLRRNDDPSEGRGILLGGRRREKPTIRELPGHPAAGVAALAFLPDGDTLASAGFDGDVRVWNARTGRLLLVLNGHAGAILDLALSPDGSLLATTGVDDRIRLWRLDPGQGSVAWRASQLPPPDAYSAGFGARDIDELAGAADGTLLIGLRDGTIARRTQGGTGPEPLSTDSDVRDRANDWLLSPDGARLGVVTPDLGEVIAVTSGKPRVTVFELPSGNDPTILEVDGLTTADFLGSGAIVTGDRAGRVRRWDVATGKAPADLGSREGRVVSVGTSAAGDRVAALWADGHLTIWDPAGPREVLSRQVARPPIVAGRLSPDGRAFAVTTGGEAGTTGLWDVARARPIFEKRQWVRAAAFSPDSRWLALGSEVSGEAELLDARTGALAVTLRGHTRRVRALSFDRAGSTLFSAGEEGSVRSWSLSAFEELSKRAVDELLAAAGEETGLVLAGLEHGPITHGAGDAWEPSPDGTSSDVRLDQLDEFLSHISDRYRHDLASVDEADGRGDRADLPNREAEIREDLKACEDLAAGGAADVRLLRIRAALRVLLGDNLKAQSREGDALAAYADAAGAASEAFAGHEDRAWPMLLTCFERHAGALHAAGKPAEAFDAHRDQIRIRMALARSGAMLAPPLLGIWQQFEQAVGLLDAEGRSGRGLELAKDAIAFLQDRLKSSPDDLDLLQGLATFCESAAVLEAPPGRYEKAKVHLLLAELAWGRVVGILHRTDRAREIPARIAWARALANLAGTTFHAAVRTGEGPAEPEPPRDVTLALLREARELAERSMKQFQMVSQAGGLTTKARESVSLLRQTWTLIEQSLRDFEDLMTETPDDPAPARP